jgi:hypothetical protein
MRHTKVFEEIEETARLVAFGRRVKLSDDYTYSMK